MNVAKENILKGLQENLVSLDEYRIHAKLDMDKRIEQATTHAMKVYAERLTELDRQQASVEAEIKSVQSV